MGVPERSNPVRVGDVLVLAVPELRDRLLENTIKTDWSRLIGPELGRRSRPGRLHAGVLGVVVDNSPCLQEMTLRSGELLAAIQRRFGAVASLRLTLGALHPVAEPAARRARSEPASSLSHEELQAVEATATSLSDPILAGCIRRLLTKDLLAHRLRDAHGRREDSRLAEREDS